MSGVDLVKSAVALCTYNGISFIEEQLDSIRLQTVQPDFVYIRDDGSVDGTVQYVEDYVKNHGLSGRWSIRVNERNLGFAENFHCAIAECQDICDVVFFSDQDDAWEPSKIEKCLAVMRSHHEVDVLCHEYDIVDGGGNISPVHGQASPAITGDGSLERVAAHNGGVYIWLGWAMAVRSSFLKRIEGYRFDGWAHDEWVWKCGQVSGSLYLLHERLGSHRIHGGNATGHKVRNRARRIDECRMKVFGDKEALRFAKDTHAPDSVARVFERSGRCGELRLELLEKRRLFNAAILLGYLDAYQVKRSWLTELMIALQPDSKMG